MAEKKEGESERRRREKKEGESGGARLRMAAPSTQTLNIQRKQFSV